MGKLILTVEDTFSILGRGLVIVAHKTESFVDFKIGDSIKVENPDQTLLETKIKGIEFLCRPKFRVETIAFSIESEINEDQVQKNADIWLLENKAD